MSHRVGTWGRLVAFMVAMSLAAVGVVLAATSAQAADFGKDWKVQRVTVPGVSFPFDTTKLKNVERVVKGDGKGPFATAYPNGISVGKPTAQDDKQGGPVTGVLGVEPGKSTISAAGIAKDYKDNNKWTGVTELRTKDEFWFQFQSDNFPQGSLIGNATGKDVTSIEISVTKQGDKMVKPDAAADGLSFDVDNKGVNCLSRLVIKFDKPLKPDEFVWMDLPKFDLDAGLVGAMIAKGGKEDEEEESPSEPATARRIALPVGDLSEPCEEQPISADRTFRI